MYTDEALGITYRSDVDEESEDRRKQKEALYDDDPDNLRPIYANKPGGALPTPPSGKKSQEEMKKGA